MGSAVTSRELRNKNCPYHSASNGQAKKTVQTFENALNKLMNEKGMINQKPERFLMASGMTPYSVSNCTPAELPLSQRPQTALDIIRPT